MCHICSDELIPFLAFVGLGKMYIYKIHHYYHIKIKKNNSCHSTKELQSQIKEEEN